MTWYWRILEMFPKSVRYQDWPRRRLLLRRYIPAAEPRFIPEGSRVHTSVIERMKRVPRYRPVNLPQRYQVETVAGPAAPVAARKKRTAALGTAGRTTPSTEG
jgi:hypothetical protein